MLKEYSATFRYLLVIIDIVIILPAFWLGYYLRTGPLSEWFEKGLGPLQDYAWLVCYLIIFTPLALYLLGAYRPFRTENLLRIIARLFISVILIIGSEAVILFFKQEWMYSRSLLLGWGLIYFALIASERVLLVSFLRSVRRGGFNFRRVAIAGTGKEAQEVVEEINANRFWGLRIEGIITEGEKTEGEIFGLKILGSLREIESIIKKHVIDDLYFTLGTFHDSLLMVTETCALVGCSLYIVPPIRDGYFTKIRTNNLGSIPLLSCRNGPIAPLQLFVKREVDLLISGMVMLIFPLIFLIIGVMIRLDSKGPILYASTRVAHNRRKFKCYKFRTMVKDADKLVHLLKEVDEIDGPVRKSSKDPRITRVGRFLRRYSIDEIPQFINIFKGEMSLVGPRPPLPDEVEQYKLSDLRKLSMPQGITGLWQVSGRDAVKSFDERLKLDLAYIDNWSLWLDL
ncbi:MAG: sugar transferase, partial [Deltaproteobacteria bacterium]|nr:sugar transferase [Deltaproteobacteria bacterium]